MVRWCLREVETVELRCWRMPGTWGKSISWHVHISKAFGKNLTCWGIERRSTGLLRNGLYGPLTTTGLHGVLSSPDLFPTCHCVQAQSQQAYFSWFWCGACLPIARSRKEWSTRLKPCNLLTHDVSVLPALLNICRRDAAGNVKGKI